MTVRSQLPVTPEEDEAMNELARRQDGVVGMGTDRLGGAVCDRPSGSVAAGQEPSDRAGGQAAGPDQAAAIALFEQWEKVHDRRGKAWIDAGSPSTREAIRRQHIDTFAELIEAGVITVDKENHAAD